MNINPHDNDRIILYGTGGTNGQSIEASTAAVGDKVCVKARVDSEWLTYGVVNPWVFGS
jgi:hypothetical protein